MDPILALGVAADQELKLLPAERMKRMCDTEIPLLTPAIRCS